jgi:hypothetical protein
LFQLTALLVNTNGTRDEVVKMFIGELLLQDSSVCTRGEFDSAFTLAGGSTQFLTARTVGFTVSNGASGIMRGFDHGNLIKTAKPLNCKYYELQERQLDDIEREIDSCYRHESLEPLPKVIIDNLQER